MYLDATRDHPRTDALSRMLAEYLVRLWTHLPAMTPDERKGMAGGAEAVIRACIFGTPDALAEAAPQLQDHLRARARSFIRRSLASSRLSPRTVARAMGVSRTQLYRAFEPAGGVAHVIQDERLKAAGRLLLRPDDTRSITEIAEAVGIFDPSSFSRMFRRSFGTTAGTWRSDARSDGNEHRRPSGFGLADFLD